MPVFILGALPVVIIAVVCLLLLLAFKQFGTTLFKPLEKIPLLGNSAYHAAIAALDWGYNLVRGFLTASLGPVANFLFYPVHMFDAMIAKVISTFAAVNGQLWHIYHTTVPWVIATAANYANVIYARALTAVAVMGNTLTHLVIAAERYALSQAQLALSRALVAVAVMGNTLTHLVLAAERYALAQAQAALARALVAVAIMGNTATRLVIGAERLTISMVAALRIETIGRVAAGVSAAEKFAQSAAIAATKAAVTDIDVAAGRIDAVVWPKIIDNVTAIEGIIATDLPAIGAWVESVPRAIPRTLAEALAATGALEGVMTRYLRDCGLPNCRNLGGFGKLLQALQGAVDDGLILALLAACLADPEGAAREVEAVMGGLIDDAASLVSSAVGFRL